MGVTEALDEVRQQLPFSMRGINSDDGSEFINAHLFRYCQSNKITFTRSHEVKEKLKALYATLNPAKLRRDMLSLQERLYKLAASKYDLVKGQQVTAEDMVYATAS